MLKLDDYQEFAVERLLKRPRYGLFDEMGLGKTPVAIMAAEQIPGPICVTAPAYLLPNWKREIERWTHSSCAMASSEMAREDKQRVLASNAKFILTSYHSWNIYPILQKKHWGGFIFDESHRMRGRNSQWTKKIFQLQNQDNWNIYQPMWFLTGTPLVRDAGDVWTFLHMMDRRVYGSYWTFVQQTCYTTPTPWDVQIGAVIDNKSFVQTMSQWSLRRLARNIPQLATLEHVEKTIWVKLPSSVYTAMKNAKKEFILAHEGMDPIHAEGSGALVARMSMWCSVPPTQQNPKLDTLMEVLEDSPERVIIWCWYRATAQEVVARLQKRKDRRPFGLITGDVSALRRQGIIETYNTTSNYIIVATIASLNTGVNLQAGRRCIFLEQSDLPDDNLQAIGRQKRRGQTGPVQVINILADGPHSMDKSRYNNVQKRGTNIRRAMLEEFLHE